MNTLGIIPARSGSKRLPGKNLLMCGGKPLLRWTVEAAMASALDRWFVSTDCIAVHELCKREGWPYQLRPPEISGDKPIESVVAHHVADFLDSTHVMLLQPTSPLRTQIDIDAALVILPTCDSLASYHDIGKHGMELLTTNGAIFAAKREYAPERLLRGPRHRCYVMPSDRSVDVDDATGLRMADILLTATG